jgi:Helicase conserved C-terminal domain
MVATDIAARGIHVDGIDLVIHADSPTEANAYLHRSGRTARAGAAGVVVTLQTPAQAGCPRAPQNFGGGRLIMGVFTVWSFGPDLFVHPVPSTWWFTNVRSCVSRGTWNGCAG